MFQFLLVAAIAAGGPQFEARSIAGKTVVGSLAAVGEKQLTLETAAGRVDFDLDQLAALTLVATPPVPEIGRVRVELIDGSLLLARQYTVESGRARLALASGRALDLPTAAVATVRFHAPSKTLDAEWARVLDARPAGDLLLVQKGDALDYHRGVLGDVTDSLVHFAVEGERLPVKRAKLGGLAYYHAGQEKLADVACRLTDAGGSLWAVRNLRLEGDLSWTTPSGVEASAPLNEVAKIDFASDRIAYLSDMKPESSQWTPVFPLDQDLPLLDQYYAIRENRAAEGQALRLGGEEYRRGLMLHSRTLVVYRLPDRYRRFQAIAGIDDQVHPRGSVHLVIRGDDRVLLEADVTGLDAPRPIDLDVSGVRRLSILVDYGRELNVGDQLLLCEARVIK